MVWRHMCIKKMKSHKLVTAVLVLVIVLGRENFLYIECLWVLWQNNKYFVFRLFVWAHSNFVTEQQVFCFQNVSLGPYFGIFCSQQHSIVWLTIGLTCGILIDQLKSWKLNNDTTLAEAICNVVPLSILIRTTVMPTRILIRTIGM